MKILLLLMCLGVAGCAGQPAPQPKQVAADTEMRLGYNKLEVVHDDKHAVTCWYVTGGYAGDSPAISCLPDRQIAAPQTDGR